MGWLSVRLGDNWSVLMMAGAIRLWVRVQGVDNRLIVAPFFVFGVSAVMQIVDK